MHFKEAFQNILGSPSFGFSNLFPAADRAWQNQRPERSHDRDRQLGAHQGSTVSYCHVVFNPSRVLYLIWNPFSALSMVSG